MKCKLLYSCPSCSRCLPLKEPWWRIFWAFAANILRLSDYVKCDLSWAFSWHSRPKRSLSQGKMCPGFSEIMSWGFVTQFRWLKTGSKERVSKPRKLTCATIPRPPLLGKCTAEISKSIGPLLGASSWCPWPFLCVNCIWLVLLPI
jgi:hypothetical protein